MCLVETENEFVQLISDNDDRLVDAAGTVAMALAQIYDVKHLEGESPDAFAGRMKITFDADEDVVREETGIEIPDLPANAPPSATLAQSKLMKFEGELSYALTWAQWLMDRLAECCDEVAADLDGIQDDNASTVEETNLRIATVLEDLFMFKAEVDEEILDFAGRMRGEFDDAKDAPDSDIQDVDTGITYNAPPANCQDSTFAAAEDLQTFIDDLSNILTYLEWLEARLAECCENLRDEMNE
jgi:hypothetical protein